MFSKKTTKIELPFIEPGNFKVRKERSSCKKKCSKVNLIRVAENFDASSEQLIKLRSQELGTTFGQIDDGFQSRIVLAAFDGLHRHLDKYETLNFP